MNMNNKITWIIQNNLVHENTNRELQEAIIKSDANFQDITVIPFDSSPLDFDHDNPNNVYYGSTSFTNYLNKHFPNTRGLFFNENFSMKNYVKQYGELMLNSDALFTTLRKFTKKPLETHPFFEEVYFIRPDGDDKSFAGQVMTLEQIYEWSKNLPVTEGISITLDTPILIADALNVKKEWRNYVVDGRIVTSSRYQMNGRRSLSAEDIPEDMIKFAESCISKYKPHDNFALDIALCGDSYYIVECGCLNGVGLYECNVDRLVSAITLWMKQQSFIEELKISDGKLLEKSVNGKLSIEELAKVKTWIPLHMIPDELKESFFKFMFGQTVSVVNDVQYVYPNDIIRWVNNLK